MVNYSYQNDCVDCPQGCIDCGRKHALYIDSLECDYCGDDADKLYIVDGQQLCSDCALSDYEVISDDNAVFFLKDITI